MADELVERRRTATAPCDAQDGHRLPDVAPAAGGARTSHCKTEGEHVPEDRAFGNREGSNPLLAARRGCSAALLARRHYAEQAAGADACVIGIRNDLRQRQQVPPRAEIGYTIQGKLPSTHTSEYLTPAGTQDDRRRSRLSTTLVGNWKEERSVGLRQD
uniref:Uncharacterized protein n=1 Tax=Oryza meridionalis TaxID=40149 RepID=A0A0E0C2Y1_9ORYZ